MVATKDTKSVYWFARVDGPKDHLHGKLKELAECIDVCSILGTYHVGKKGENPHTHFVVEMNKEVQKQSYALRLKKLFGIEQKTQYALDVWDARRAEYGAVSYLFHEDDAPVLVSKGWPEGEISEAKHIAKEANKVIEISRQKAETKLVGKAIEHFSQWTEKPSTFQIFDYMVREIHSGQNYHPGYFRLKQFVEEVEIKLTADPTNLIAYQFQKLFS